MTAPTWVPFQPTAQRIRVAATRGQAGRRRLVVLTDQHTNPKSGEGRAWWGYAERAAGEDAVGLVLIGDLYPVATDSHIVTRAGQPPKFYRGWGAPWYPPSHFINTGASLEEGPVLTIQYKAMETAFTEAERSYLQRAVTAAASHNLPIPEPGGPVDFRVQAIVGIPPMSPRIPRAALTGHEWLLGFKSDAEDKDETLARLLDRTADLIAIQKAAREMEAKGARVADDVATAKLAALEAENAKMRQQMADMMQEFREAMQAGMPVETVPRKRRGRPAKVPAPETGDAEA